MTSLDQESKATQPLKQPQKHFKCIGTSHNIIMPSDFHLNFNFGLTQIHYSRVSIQDEHLNNLQSVLFSSVVIT